MTELSERPGGDYVGCVNPDGTVLNEKGDIVGRRQKDGIAVSYDGDFLGTVSDDGLIINAALLPVGCIGTYGDVFNRNGGYIGHIQDKSLAFDMQGNFLNTLNEKGKVSVAGKPDYKVLSNNVLADDNNNIVGILLSHKSVVGDADGSFMGRLFPDGKVYNESGGSVGKISGDGMNFYNGTLGKIHSLRSGCRF